jgi:hypothetical protein
VLGEQGSQQGSRQASESGDRSEYGDGETAEWRIDPLGHFDYRWWDGRGWTDRVSSRGVRSIDPYTPAAAHPVIREEAPADPAVVWDASLLAAPPENTTLWPAPAAQARGHDTPLPYGRGWIGGLLALAGAIVMAVGVWLPATDLERTGPRVTFYDSGDGKVVFWLAIALVALSAIALLRAYPSKALALCGTALAVVALAVVIGDRVHPPSGFGTTHVTFASGLDVCLLGCVMVIVGTVLCAFAGGLSFRSHARATA